jgi:U3 small nucleolar RNA-associated protein 23
MRVKRKTKVRKYLRYYRTVHGFREPYKILLDGNFVSACVGRKLDDSAAHHVCKFLSCSPSECKIFTTRAVRKELESLGKEFQEAANQTHKLLLVNEENLGSNNSGFGEKSAAHIENVKESIVHACKEDNRERFIVCTQDGDLKKQLRKASAKVPIIFCHVSGLQMEPPVDADSESGFAGQKERNEGVSEREIDMLNKAGNGEALTRSMYDVKTNVRFKMKKTKGPNPLSNLKKKKKRGGPDGLSAPDVSTEGGKKKKRKRR